MLLLEENFTKAVKHQSQSNCFRKVFERWLQRLTWHSTFDIQFRQLLQVQKQILGSLFNFLSAKSWTSSRSSRPIFSWPFPPKSVRLNCNVSDNLKLDHPIEDHCICSICKWPPAASSVNPSTVTGQALISLLSTWTSLSQKQAFVFFAPACV